MADEREDKPDSEPEGFFDDSLIPEDDSEPLQDSFSHSRKIDIAKTFAGSLDNKIRILQEAIEEINRLIELRKAVSRTIQERIDGEIFNSETLMLQVKPWQLGHNQSIEMRRLGLEREILSLRKEKRAEDVRAWEHISALLRLRRQFVMEHENLLSSKRTLEGSAP